MNRRGSGFVVLACILAACADSSGRNLPEVGPTGDAGPTDTSADTPQSPAVARFEVRSWDAPEPLTGGSRLTAKLSSPLAWTAATLTLRTDATSLSVEASPGATTINPTFELPADAFADAADTTTALIATLEFDGLEATGVALERTARAVLTPAVSDITGSVFQLGRPVELPIGAVLSPSEGSTRFTLTGTLFSDDDSGDREVQITGTVQLPDNDRARGTLALPGLSPGVLEGALTLANESISGRSTAEVTAEFEAAFIAPTPTPPTNAIIAPGFELPVFDGLSTDGDVVPVAEFTGTDAFGDSITWQPECDARDGRLWCAFAPDSAGAAAGFDELGPAGRELEVQVRLILNDPEFPVLSERVSSTIQLVPAVQYVRVTFEPGFYRTLERFGLQVAAVEIEAKAIARMNLHIDSDRVRFVSENTPIPAAPAYTTTVAIAGPDPSGRGLLGFDNSPGKDVGNQRLGDRIGGAQSGGAGETEFGGVFVESFLFWSTEPLEGLARPASAQTSDPLFDSIFAEFIRVPATLDELQSDSNIRNDAATRAVEALAALIAETSAHEVGHALGLASPEVPDGSFHRVDDGPLCLMDAGNARPLRERMGLDGGLSGLCGDEAAYIRAVLPGRFVD
jgi:hypothetical protein